MSSKTKARRPVGSSLHKRRVQVMTVGDYRYAGNTVKESESSKQACFSSDHCYEESEQKFQKVDKETEASC